MSERSHRLLFLSWDSPWPPHSGAALRSFGLLGQIHREFPVDLVVLTRQPLSADQTGTLLKIVGSITRIPMRDISGSDRLHTLLKMFRLGYPYHSAVLEESLKDNPDLRRRIVDFPDIVFTGQGHWGTLVYNQRAPNWILNQCDADVEFWRAYAQQVTSPHLKILALGNYLLSRRHFPRIYARVGQIVSVCEEDRRATSRLAPKAQIAIIENGIDCSYFTPKRVATSQPARRLLFTGSSAWRNQAALRDFARHIFPLIKNKMSDIQLIVAGNFSPVAQRRFRRYPEIRFTGRTDDMRPFFDQSDVFIAPFRDTHGSKLKVAEAMAMGIPIVSTPAGVRGFALVDGESVLIGRTPAQFAENVLRLLEDEAKRSALGEAARQIALETIDWRVLGDRLLKIIERTQAGLS
jgi:glycosyltransferase involved in cell wall biosynthesis